MISLQLFLIAVGIYIINLLLSLSKHYHDAKTLAIPIIVSPFDLFHPMYFLIHPVISLLYPLIPPRFGKWTIVSTADWPFQDKGKIQQELGPPFALVCPWNYKIILADPKAAESLYHRRKDFERMELLTF